MQTPSPRTVAPRFASGPCSPLRRATVGLLAIAASCLATAPAHAITIDWVTVGDANNAADSTGYGAVAEPFQIMKYEFTNSQYAAFLNAVDPTGSNPYYLYSYTMLYQNRGGILNTGIANGSRYVVKPNMGDKPVIFTSWFDAARVANWLHNGQGSGSTETGAYTLDGQTWAYVVPPRNPDARFFVPTENQWYKAAYYKGGGTNAGYWAYGTQSNTLPTAVTADSTGNGQAASGGNSANYNDQARWGEFWNGYYGDVTTVGTNGRSSAYGAFDMTGNVAEWNDLTGLAVDATRGMRGGSFNSDGSYVGRGRRTWFGAESDAYGSGQGFRLAGLMPSIITGSQTYNTQLSGTLTVSSGASVGFLSGFTGTLTVTGGTATLGGSVAGTVTVGAGAAATIASGASLTNAKVSLAPGAILSVARGASVPVAAGNIGGITVSTTTGLAVKVLAGTVAADTTIFANTSPKGNFTASGGNRVVGDVLTFQGTGTATWVLQMQYNQATLPQNEATMADAGKLFLTWRNPGSDAWVNAVDGNTGGVKQFYQRAWQAGDALGSYGVDVTTDTVWAVINHNSDFAVTAVPEPTTLALAAGGLAGAAWAARRRRRARGLCSALHRATVGLLAVAAACLAMAPARAVTIEWSTVVSSTGNAPDPLTGYGSVDRAYRIMKFEFTNSQYAAFLNAIDPDGTNPNAVYTSFMGSDARGGITNTGTTAGSIYAVKTNMGDKPVNFVSWWDAARVSNWLHNGAQTYGSTNSTASAPQNTGAYSVGEANFGNAVARNSGALFYVPTENQWYKAAYYKGGSTTAGYWDYATQSDAAPTAVTSGSTGIGSAGSTGNFANYDGAADWNDQNANVTAVGTNGGSSFYGAFDMSGNVAEWNDLDGLAPSGSSRGLRGGSSDASAFNLSSSGRLTGDPSLETNFVGFRLASPVAVPEPSTWVLGAAGIACAGWRGRWRHPPVAP